MSTMSTMSWTLLAWSPELLEEPCPECGMDLLKVWVGWSQCHSPIGISEGGICMECDHEMLNPPGA